MTVRAATTSDPRLAVTTKVALMLAVGAIVLLAGAAVWSVSAAPADTEHAATLERLQDQAVEFPQRNPNRESAVYDTVDILTTQQETSIQNDINRASGLGVEMLVYTRMSADSAAESQAFADRLNSEWNVESEEGANDGLVYLLTVNPEDPATNSIVISAGAAALPIRQLDRVALDTIIETEMTPAVEDGDFITAIHYGTRRVLNAMEYSPPSAQPLSSLQESLSKVATILGALLLQFAVLGFFVVTVFREHRFTIFPSARSLGIHAVTLALASIGVGLVGIAGRNAFASLTALGVLVFASCVLPLVIARLGRSKQVPGRVIVGPHRVHGGHAIGGARG